MKHSVVNLPTDLGDGLLLRRAAEQDIPELGEFNIRVHSEDLEDPEVWLREWTRDLLAGQHPTTGLHNFTVVVDQNAGGRIISSAGLIPQEWRYEGISFGVGRPELIGTDAAFRRRGLIRKQMDVLHCWSEAQGHLAQAITGIPHYYRRFGYEMALNLGGSRLFPLDRLRKLAPDHSGWSVRDATMDDLPMLDKLYGRHCTASMISRPRDRDQWYYEMEGAHETSQYRRHFRVIESGTAKSPLGYFEFAAAPGRFLIREIAAAEGQSLRAVAMCAARNLYQSESKDAGETSERPSLLFTVGAGHPVYEALARELAANSNPYAWYVRVSHLGAFLMALAPVLEQRVAQSVIAGYSGTKRLNCNVEALTMDWQAGKLASVEPFEPTHFYDGDAYFPEHAFLQLLFGFRSADDLHHSYPDFSSGNGETYVLLKTLFPCKPSSPVGLG